MAAPYGLNVVESCLTCKLREERFFCNLKGPALQELERIKFSTSYPAGSILFVEGQEPRGVMILCQGRVKLSMSSANGKTLILKIAGPGEVLGLTATIAGELHEMTAEAVDPVQINLIRRADFQNFLARYQDACLHAAQELSAVHNSACHEIRILGLSQSVPERLARLVLDWDAKQSPAKQGSVRMALTHEEISEFLGTSRETITRVLLDFKKRKIIQLKGATLVILDRLRLQAMAGEPIDKRG